MSEPPENSNPYESPHSQASEEAGDALPGDLGRRARRGNVTYDVLVVIAAIVWSMILSEVGAMTASSVTSFGALWLGRAIAASHWMVWSAVLAARVPGEFLGGWILGRFLRGISPGSVAAGAVTCMGLVSFWLIASADPGTPGYVAEIGLSEYRAQVIAGVLVGGSVVLAGLWLGRKGQQAADARSATTDGFPRVLAMRAASFTVGREEVHEIGVLHLESGREIYTVDGREELNLKTGFWENRASRRLTVGDREPHEIVIRRRRFPLGSAQAFVDGELAVEELFPDTRLLLRVGVIVLAILAAGCLALGLVALTLHLAV